MNLAVHYMSERHDGETPWEVFNPLHAEFNFTLDPCALPETAKCAKFYTPEDDGLAQDWTGERVFMNPPYGKAIRHWMRKAYEHAQRGGVVVCLVPARTDTAWWHDYTKGAEIRFIRGRVKFGGYENGAPFPSAIVVFA